MTTLNDEPADLIPRKLTDEEWQAQRDRARAEAIAAGPPACCTCGKATKFDGDVIGVTVGGLWLRGWYMCPDQHGTLASGLAKVSEAPTWTIAKGGRSVEIGTGRIRFGQLKIESGERLDVVGLMTRIARLPELEARVAELEAAVHDTIVALAIRVMFDAHLDGIRSTLTRVLRPMASVSDGRTSLSNGAAQPAHPISAGGEP